MPSGGGGECAMPSGGEAGGAMPSGGEAGGAMPSGGEAGGAMPSGGGGGGAMPSGGGGECAMSSGGEAGGAMPFRTSGGGELGGGGGGGVLSPNEGALGGDGGVGVLTKNLQNTCQVSMCSRGDLTKKWGWRWEDRESKNWKCGHRKTESAVAFAARMACLDGMAACAWQRPRRTIRGETCRRMVLENLRVPREGVVVLREDSCVRHREEHWSQRKGSGGSKNAKRRESRHRTVTVTAQLPGDRKMLTTAVRREAHQPTDSRNAQRSCESGDASIRRFGRL